MVRVRVKEKRNTEPDRNSLKNIEDVKKGYERYHSSKKQPHHKRDQSKL